MGEYLTLNAIFWDPCIINGCITRKVVYIFIYSRAICWPSVNPIFSKWSYLCYFLDRKRICCIFEEKKSEIFFWLFTCLSLHLLSVTSFLSILNSDLVRMFTRRQRRIPVQTFRLILQKRLSHGHRSLKKSAIFIKNQPKSAKFWINS